MPVLRPWTGRNCAPRPAPDAAQCRAKLGHAAFAGFLAGVVYLVAQMTQSAFVRPESAWTPLMRVAALLLGPQAAASASNDELPTVLAVGLLLHVALSVLFGILVARATQSLGEQGAVLGGLACGIVLYVLNFQWIAPAWFPWFEVGGGAMTCWDHAIFGVLVAVFSRRARTSP